MVRARPILPFDLLLDMILNCYCRMISLFTQTYDKMRVLYPDLAPAISNPDPFRKS